MDPTQLLAALEYKRADYDASLTLDRFFIDAYTGGGGFAGKIKPAQIGFWGYRDSYTAATSTKGSYLQKFHREDDDKYASRVEIAHYPGYVRTLTDLKLSFLLRKPPTKADDEPWQDWYENVDGAGTTFDELLPDIVLRAAILGWCPVLVDAPRDAASEAGEKNSQAQAEKKGIRPKLVPLFPANIIDWDTDESGALSWVKIRVTSTERKLWSDKPTQVETYTIWTHETWHRYTVRKSTVEGAAGIPIVTAETPDPVPHDFGRVPLAILRHAPSPDDCVRGIPMHSDVAFEALRLFNLLSERDEHIRGQVFALLCLAADFKDGVKDPNRPQDGGEQSLGSGNMLEYHYGWPAPSLIAPPASVAATLATAIAECITELFRLGRVEFARGVASATSGTARQYEFAQTNRAIHDFASQVCRWWEDVLELSGVKLGASPEQRKKARVTPPENFDVEDMQGEITQAESALRLNLPAPAVGEIKRRLIDRVLPNLDPRLRKVIEAQLEEEAAPKPVALPANAGEPPTDTVPSAPPTEAVPVDPSTPPPVAIEEAKDPSTALNGAQVAALQEIVSAVARRDLPRATGVEMILAAFPLDRPAAERVVGEVGRSFFADEPARTPRRPSPPNPPAGNPPPPNEPTPAPVAAKKPGESE